MNIDTLLLVPFEPPTASLLDATSRATLGGNLFAPLLEAMSDLESDIGHSLDLNDERCRPVFGGVPLTLPKHRSLTAVTLASALERAGLSWQILDPGVQELAYWRRELGARRSTPPRTVAVSTTYSLSLPWLMALLRLIREIFPHATVVVGGPFYATDAEAFLRLDADVFCIGEGDVRFPQIVAALKAGRRLDRIEGLYLRENGTLRYTGRAAQLDMQSLPLPDWSLASRIQPAIDLDRDLIEAGVETQRGCVFKCEFCTYRTLASPALASPERAVERLLGTSAVRRGYINLTDATASFPRDRWQRVLELLVARGGAPHPIWAFARAGDISWEIARLMKRAGVGLVFIGQESGDQRILNRMRKGTRVSSVRPAIEALGAHQVAAVFGMIHGFPGETDESIANTRRLLEHINDGFERLPPVMFYTLGPFFMQDFASIAQDTSLRAGETKHPVAYRSGELTSERAARACLETVIEVSKTPHAPCWAFMLIRAPQVSGIELTTHPARAELHGWLKAVERGVAVHLERALHGTAPNAAEMATLGRRILAGFRDEPRWRSTLDRCVAGVSSRLFRRLRREWTSEAGAGTLTRLMLAGAALRDVGSLRQAAETYRTGSYPQRVDAPRVRVEHHASALTNEAIERGRVVKLGWRPREASTTPDPIPGDVADARISSL